MLLPQRLTNMRLLPILVVFVVCIFLLTTARFRHSSFVHSISHKLAGDQSKHDEKPLDDKTQKFQPPHAPSERPPLAPGECIPEVEFLRRAELGLSDNIVYSRRCIRPIGTDKVDRDVVANISRPLINHKTTINLTSCSHVEFVACDHLPLDVPFAYPEEQYDHFVFGVSTTYKRLSDSLPAFAHWLTGTKATLVAVIVDAEKDGEAKNLTALEELYAQSDVILSTAKGNASLTTDQNHFTMLKDILDATTPNTKWIGVLDDDTFFPSLYPLNQALKTYDHTKSLWLGALSEDFGSVRSWGFMAFGGAGIFLTMSLARQLEPYIHQCIAEARLPTGDAILRDCVYDHSTTKLTLVPGLFQHDMHGDVSGFYESGVRPLSLHHWKSWYKEPVDKMAAVTGICGDCFLQRWQFGEDTLFANGYSISLYRNGVESVDLSRMEGSWHPHGPEYDFSVGPLRPKLGKDEKRSYRLKDVQLTETGGFRQIYVYKADWEAGEEMDEVVELLWES